MQIGRTWHTAIRLKPVQVRYQLRHRIRSGARRITGSGQRYSIPAGSTPVNLAPWISKPHSAESNTFSFLNREIDMKHGIRWDEPGYGKLWAYNLNYMDCLLQEGMSSEEGSRYIMDFIRDLPGNRTGIEPYPISLRGINWIKFVTAHRIRDTRIDHSLFAQYRILEAHPEYHLLGNHLLENGLSLLFGAIYFRNPGLYAKAKKILATELEEQVLSDGAHFELSPMYHQVILDRLLDGINLLKHNAVFGDQGSLLALMTEKASRMLGWLDQITFRDGIIPLFNDSAFGIAPSTLELSGYAGRLDIQGSKVTPGQSGYRGFSNKKYEIRLDVGEVGPAYQPGHAHADTMNFELYVQGKPLVVDTGTSTYEKNGRRLVERGTAAHNTVQVNGMDSSEVWGGFRMARRANILSLSEDGNTIEAGHNGYRRLGVAHHRHFRFEPGSIRITDRLTGRNHKGGTARFHFHPSVQPEIRDQSIRFQGGSISFTGASQVSLAEFHYAPGFNLLQPAKSVEVRFSGEVSSTFTFN
jgi:hypothetical protein